MKQLILFAILAISSTQALAWKETAPAKREYAFKFDPEHKLGKETWLHKETANSYEDAFDSAAQQCFRHYKGEGKVTEDRGLDIIDICANPRS